MVEGVFAVVDATCDTSDVAQQSHHGEHKQTQVHKTYLCLFSGVGFALHLHRTYYRLIYLESPTVFFRIELEPVERNLAHT